MPTYQYECDACGYSFDFLQSMLDKKLKKCPACNKHKLHRLIGAGSGIIFKGSGFYETDYKKKELPKGTSTIGSAESPAKTAKSETKENTSSVKKADNKEAGQVT